MAGIFPYNNAVTIIVDYDPGGDPGEFEQFMREAPASWFDGAMCGLVPPEVQKEQAWKRIKSKQQ